MSTIRISDMFERQQYHFLYLFFTCIRLVACCSSRNVTTVRKPSNRYERELDNLTIPKIARDSLSNLDNELLVPYGKKRSFIYWSW